jgi:type IV pilus assembly protein PilM
MAASKRIYSLNLGTQTVALAEFQKSKAGGLVLSRFRSSALLADPTADPTRMAQARMAVAELAGGMKAAGATVNYAVSAQSVFTRFVKLPSVGEEQAEQIVAFEAQQNVPFPIDEVVWGYQLVDTGGAEVEVVLVAIKSDLLDQINEAVEHSGMRTGVVDVSPIAIYNAFRYNYSDLEGCSLLVDIGSRTTNLIFVEGQKVFSRSIPLGGAKITEAIAKDFNENFGDAEERKKRDAFVSLGGAYADAENPEVAKVSKLVRNSMTRLHAEVARSISFYRSQQGGGAPSRVYLCGGSAGMPYMREFFNEKLQLPVEHFNPLRNVAVGAGVNAEEVGEQAHMMGELVGLALRSVSSCPMELNLQPPSVVQRKQSAEVKPYLVLAGLCLLFGLAAPWLYLERSADIATIMNQKVEEQTAPLKEFEKKIKAAREELKNQQEAALPFIKLSEEREFWPNLIQDVNSRLKGDLVWVVSIKPLDGAESPEAKAGKLAKGKVDGAEKTRGKGSGPNASASRPGVMLRGLYLSNSDNAKVVDDFVRNLGESDLYEVSRDELTRSVPNDNEWAYEFSVPLLFKTAAATSEK